MKQIRMKRGFASCPIRPSKRVYSGLGVGINKNRSGSANQRIARRAIIPTTEGAGAQATKLHGWLSGGLIGGSLGGILLFRVLYIETLAQRHHIAQKAGHRRSGRAFFLGEFEAAGVGIAGG